VFSLFSEFETYLKTKIEKLAHIDSDNLDIKSPDYHEHFSTKSFDESKASLYFTPTEGHLSPQPLQVSPIHINYIYDGPLEGLEATGYSDEAARAWRPAAMKSSLRGYHSGQRNSFTLPRDYLEEADESLHGNFIIPDPVYTDPMFGTSSERFHEAAETASSSIKSVTTPNDPSTRKRRKRYRDHRRSRHSIENETLLMQDMVHDVSKGARPKVYGIKNYMHNNDIGE
jgi:hypothetical protein